MSVLALLDRVSALGGRVEARGELLHVEAPAPLPEPLLEELRENKPALLQALMPSDIDASFRRCGELGVLVRLVDRDGGWTLEPDPIENVTPALREALTRHRAEVIAELIRGHICAAPGCRREAYIYVPGESLVPLCERHGKQA